MKGDNGSTVNLKQGSIILLLATIAVKMIGALFKIPLSSDWCLGDLGFGYFSYVYDIFMPIYFIALSGFPVAISKTVASYIADNRSYMLDTFFKVSRKTLFLISIVCFALFAVLIVPFAYFTDDGGNSIHSLIAVAPSIIFCFYASCYKGFFEGMGNMRPAAAASVIEALCKLVAGLSFAVAVIRLTGNPALAAAAAVYGITLGTVLSALYLGLKFKRTSYKFKSVGAIEAVSVNKNQMAKKLIFLSAPIVLTSLCISITALVDAFTVRPVLSDMILKNDLLKGQDFAVLVSEYRMMYGDEISANSLATLLYGIKGKAFTLFNLVPSLTVAIGVGLIPSVTAGAYRENPDVLNENVNAAFKMTALISFPAGVGYLFFGERIMSLLYGSTASSAVGGRLLMIYAAAAVFAGFTLPTSGILQALGKQNYVFFSMISGIAVKIALNLLLCAVPDINIAGAAYSAAACFCVMCVLNVFFIFYKSGIKINTADSVLKPAVSAFICVAAGYCLSLAGSSGTVTVLSVLLAAAAYFIMLILLNFFEESDILALPAGEKMLKFTKKMKIIR